MLEAADARHDARVYVIHENDEWVEPLRAAFQKHCTPLQEWHLGSGSVDLTQAPPHGIFYNRMSASSHTRGHRYAPELAAATLAWLEHHGRTIVNGPRALELEVSKVAQYTALEGHGIETPSTIAAIGRQHIEDATVRLGFPLILKHNRAGKGLGVQLIASRDALCNYLNSGEFEDSIDGITLVQRYIEAPKPFITRVEFVGGRLLYAVQVDTSDGFELCPAEACKIDETSSCPMDADVEKFRILEDFDHPLVPKWEAFLDANDIQVAGIEFITDASGRAFTYDVNTNTNYNPAAEARAGRYGMTAITLYLAELLHQQTRQAAA